MNESRSSALSHFLEIGGRIVPSYDSGATIGRWGEPSSFTDDREVILSHWRAGRRRFQFIPDAAGFVCFDLDCKRGKDGIAELLRLFTEEGIALPRYMIDLPQNFPAYTRSPSGGLHLYFRYGGSKRFKSSELPGAPGLEIKHAKCLLTAPGAERNGEPYRFYGDLREAPSLPPIIERLLPEARAADAPRPIFWGFSRNKDYDLTLDQIADVIYRQGEYSPGVSRNRYTFELAKFAHRKGIDREEVETYIRGLLEADDFTAREIAQTIASAYESSHI